MKPTAVHPAVVIGLDPSAVGVVRSLSARGVPVIAIEQRPGGPRDMTRWMSSRTRLCRKIFVEPPLSEDALLDCLVDLGKTLGAKGVLLPSIDEAAMCLSRHRDRLSEWYLFQAPEPHVLSLLSDKAEFQAFGEQIGLDLPRTWIRPDADTLERLREELPYPCIIKPAIRDIRWKRAHGGAKVIFVEGPNALAEHYRRALAHCDDLLIQEVIPGPDSELYFSHVYYSRDSALLASWTGRKLRQLPIGFGSSTLTETVDVPRVAEQSKRLLEQLQFKGYASIEFKRDSRDGIYKALEVTAARVDYTHCVGAIAGIDIPWIWYRDLIGERPEAVQRFDLGARWCDEFRDLLAATQYIRSGQLSVRQWLSSYRGNVTPALASLEDPMPAVYLLLRVALGVGKAAWRLARSRGG